MDLHVDDDGFVRAPAAACYRTLTDVERWPSFWPDTEVVALGEDRFTLRAGRGRRALALEVAAGGWRHDQGFTLALAGALDGTAEFWLEPGHGGTVVHHLVTAHAASRPLPTLRAYRRWLRTGLWGLKDLLQAAERERQGLVR